MIFKFSKNNVYKLIDYEGFAKGFLSNELADKIIERGGTVYPIRVNDNGDIFGVIYGDGQTEWDEIIFDKEKEFFEPLNEVKESQGTSVSFVGLKAPKNRISAEPGIIGFFKSTLKTIEKSGVRPNSNSTWNMPIDMDFSEMRQREADYIRRTMPSVKKFAQIKSRMPDYSTSLLHDKFAAPYPFR